ncbi:hypothetical protein [Roseateles sp. L2-2]|uniref:hypothetical protein n=1 Tax=Roseateles sp. L2-2 TaxID=3422597 RepID=UPI003D365F9D
MLTTVFARRPRLVVIAAALVGALGLSACNPYVAYLAHQEDASIVKAAPFFESMQRGVFPTDAEIKAANIGAFESMLLAQVAYRRAIDSAMVDYETQWSSLGVEEMLDPEFLLDPQNRASARAALQAAEPWHAAFRQRFTTVIDSAEQEIKGLIASSLIRQEAKTRTMEEYTSRMRDYLHAATAVRAQHQILLLDLLKFLDEHPKAFRLSGGDDPSLIFRDVALEDQFHRHLDHINAVLDRSALQDQAFDEAQAKSVQRANEALKRRLPAH